MLRKKTLRVLSYIIFHIYYYKVYTYLVCKNSLVCPSVCMLDEEKIVVVNGRKDNLNASFYDVIS